MGHHRDLLYIALDEAIADKTVSLEAIKFVVESATEQLIRFRDDKVAARAAAQDRADKRTEDELSKILRDARRWNSKQSVKGEENDERRGESQEHCAGGACDLPNRRTR